MNVNTSLETHCPSSFLRRRKSCHGFPRIMQINLFNECTCLQDWFVLVAGPPVPLIQSVPSLCPTLLSAHHLRKVVDMWASWNMSSTLSDE